MENKDDTPSRIRITGTTITVLSDEPFYHVLLGNTRAYVYNPEKNKTFTGNTEQFHIKLENVHN